MPTSCFNAVSRRFSSNSTFSFAFIFCVLLAPAAVTARTVATSCKRSIGSHASDSRSRADSNFGDTDAAADVVGWLLLPLFVLGVAVAVVVDDVVVGVTVAAVSGFDDSDNDGFAPNLNSDLDEDETPNLNAEDVEGPLPAVAAVAAAVVVDACWDSAETAAKPLDVIAPFVDADDDDDDVGCCCC